jgi:hypothetical protein
MISLRSARLRKGAGAVVAALLVAALRAPPHRPPSLAQGPCEEGGSRCRFPWPRALAPDEFADAYPTHVRRGQDLQLHPENARKAEALALFCQALLRKMKRTRKGAGELSQGARARSGERGHRAESGAGTRAEE